MPVLTHIGLLVACREAGGQGELHGIADAALCFSGERIRWVGKRSALPRRYRAQPTWDARGALVTPGLIDPHTHLCFAGDRFDEHVARTRGETYLAIAQRGGGILRTVDATRRATRSQLIAAGKAALRLMATQGVTTVEAKSGYGLTLRDELKQLEAYRALDAQQPLDIVPTLLAAHTVPREAKHDRASYLQRIVAEILPEVAARRLAKFCDVFLEQGAFSYEEAEIILRTARRHGLVAKLHADQLSASGGARLAAKLGAQSADHLEHTKPAEARRMARAGVIGVTLPAASLYTGGPALDARPLLAAGLEIAVGSDYNPGSAPSPNLRLSLLLAATLNRMTPSEALKGATLIAAKSLGLAHDRGSLEPGKLADFALFEAPSVESLVLGASPRPALATIKRGVLIHGRRLAS